MPVSGNVPITRTKLPPGVPGTDQTVSAMSSVAMGVYGAKSPRIRALAIDILRDAQVPEKNYPMEMVAIHNWVRDQIRYVRDAQGQETISTPEETAFNSKAEDCDGKSVLEAALLGAIGFKTRFVVVGWSQNCYAHVYLQAQLGNRWVSLDPIMRQHPAGWEAPNMPAKKVYAENDSEGLPMSGLQGYIGDARVQGTRPANYVTMESMMDQNGDCSPLMANPPNQNLPHRIPQSRPLDRMGVEGMGLEGLGATFNPAADRIPEAHAQRGTILAVPEGADSIFARPAKYYKGVPDVVYGPKSLAARTPGRAVSVSGLGEGETAQMVPSPIPSPGISKGWLAVAALAMVGFFWLKK